MNNTIYSAPKNKKSRILRYDTNVVVKNGNI